MGMESAVRADDLCLFEVEGVWCGVAEYHVCDGEGGFVDVVLGGFGVVDVDPGDLISSRIHQDG